MSHGANIFGWIWDKVKQRAHDDVSWATHRNAPQIPQNPYMGDWGALIGQLQNQAAGRGPSLAQAAYQQAHDEGMRNQMSMAAGGSMGAARQAGLNMSRMNQGMAQGLATARLQEQLGAQQALTGALQGAGSAWFQPQSANLQATMATPTNGQQLLNFLTQITQAGATIYGAGAGGGGVPRAGGTGGTQWIGPPGGNGQNYG